MISLTSRKGPPAASRRATSRSGGYTLSGNELTFTDIGGTMMACVDEGVTESEVAFLDAMSQVETFTMEGDELNLHRRSGGPRFRSRHDSNHHHHHRLLIRHL